MTTTAYRYTVYSFRLHGSLPGREIGDKMDNIQTGGGVQSPLGYSHQILTLLHHTVSIGGVAIPSTQC